MVDKPRDLFKVINDLYSVVDENKDLCKKLMSIQSSYTYSSPELHTMWWNETARLLNDNITMMTEEQIKKVGIIFNGR